MSKAKKKIEAAAQMALGGAQTISGVATGTGHGILGKALKNNTGARNYIGKRNVEKGMKNMREGYAKWNAPD